MRENGLLIAIDGPAGTGKSSVGKAVAMHYGYSFLSTGEMYRALGYEALSAAIPLEDAEAVAQCAKELNFTFERRQDASLKIIVNGKDLGANLHADATAQAASKTSAVPQARATLTQKMREVGMGGGIIMEGRDIGTVVFPDADVKIYLDATAAERAQRRFKQLKEAGMPADYDALLKSIQERDYRDSTRKTAPLKAAQDAVVIDSSAMTMDEVIKKVLEIIDAKK